METTLRISDINLDFHGRAAISEGVETLAEVLDQLPPPRVLRDAAGVLRAVDGVHTLLAAAKAGDTEWPCIVVDGSEDEAREAAAKANLDAGNRQPLTNADKRYKVELLLGHPDWRGRSDGEIAEELGFSQPFVSKVRRERTQNGSESVRIGRDGRVVDTSNIGKSPAARALDFVAHATRDGYLSISGGRVMATSRALAASAPFDSPFAFQPKAAEFIRAVGRGGFTLRRLPDGRVAVDHGDHVVPVPVTRAPFPVVTPDGDDVRVGPELVPTLRRLEPWFGGSGALLRGRTAYVANDLSAVALDLSVPLFDRDLRLPPEAAAALVDINEVPTRAQLGRDHLFLHLSGDRWDCYVGDVLLTEGATDHRVCAGRP